MPGWTEAREQRTGWSAQDSDRRMEEVVGTLRCHWQLATDESLQCNWCMGNKYCSDCGMLRGTGAQNKPLGGGRRTTRRRAPIRNKPTHTQTTVRQQQQQHVHARPWDILNLLFRSIVVDDEPITPARLQAQSRMKGNAVALANAAIREEAGREKKRTTHRRRRCQT